MIDKKYIILIFIIILIVVCGLGFFVFNQFQVGSAYLSAPMGYHAETHHDGVVNLTNGYDSLILNQYSNNNKSQDVKVPINYYNATQQKHNLSVELKNFSVNDIKVYKTIVNNGTNVYHYWFVKDGRMYEFVSFNGNPNTDALVSDLIKSMKNSYI